MALQMNPGLLQDGASGENGFLAEKRDRPAASILAGGMAGEYSTERHSQAVGGLLQAAEREMNASLELRQARAGLSMLLEAIWPGSEGQSVSEDQNGAADFAGAGAFLVPPVPPATLDELEARYRRARAAWEEAQRHKGAAVERFLHARTNSMR